MSDMISSDGASETSSEAARKPKPQPFSQSVPERRPAGESPRASSIYDESEPVVRSEAKPKPEPAAAEPKPTVTGNAPERRPAENPFPKAAPKPAAAEPQRAARPSEPVAKASPQPQPRAAAQPSSTLKAAEQLRAAAGEKARQLREVAEARTRQAQQTLPDLLSEDTIEEIPEAVAKPATPVAREAAPAPAQPPVTTAPSAATLSPSAQEKVDEWKEIAEATWADASIVLKDIQKEGERYVRANPTRAAVTALGIGFVLGVFLKR